jgi:uncharacterized protein YdeI (BOF family)
MADPQTQRIVDLDLAGDLSDLDWLVVSQMVGGYPQTLKVRLKALQDRIVVAGGEAGQISIRNFNGYIQWKYSTEVSWTNLVALADLVGATGISDQYKTISSTELTVGFGTANKQTLVVEAGLSYTPEQYVVISQATNHENHMHASVDSYNSTTGQMVVTVTKFSGSGTFNSWTVNLAGAIGSQGATGSMGATGPQGVEGSTGPSGAQGSTGPSGNTGATGVQGATGSTGLPGDKYNTISNTFLTVGDGVAGKQTLTVEQNLSYSPNQSVTITMASNIANHMHGYIFSYNKTTGELVVVITSHSGTGQTSSAWTVNLAGAVGTAGSTGATGLTGATGPAGSNFTVEANAGLIYQNSILSTIYNTLIADGVNSTAVGGASAQAAAIWKAKTLVGVLDTILFPDQLPTYTVPTLAISSTQSGVLEIGTPINQTITLTATENDAGAFSYLSVNRAGSSIYNTSSLTAQDVTDIASQYGYADPNNPNKKYVISYNDTLGTVTSSSITWTGTGNYSAGLAKKNNKGADDSRSFAVRSVNAAQAASTGFQSSGITVTGIYPYFYGKSSTAPTAGNIATQIADNLGFKVLTAASGDLTVTFNASAEYVWLAVYTDYPLKTKWYNTALNNGNVGDGQFILSPTSYAISSPQGLWSGKTYNIYISSGATNTEGSIIFQN